MRTPVVGFAPGSLTFDHRNGAESFGYLDQIQLIGDDEIDLFIGETGLFADIISFFLTQVYSQGLEILHGGLYTELLFGRLAAHAPACPMGAGTETFWIALAPY